MPLTLMYITNDPQIALIAEKCGVQRIWVDLETLGKEERQKGMNTVKSHHTVDDVKRIAPLLKVSEMLVRVNPWNKYSEKEIDDVIEAGAQIVMLPMWKSTVEVKKFINAVGKRVKTTLLLETKEAEACLDEVLELPGVDEIHIGLNDLHLSYGLNFMFELLSNGTVERICKKIRKKGIPYGFGGIARLGNGLIPAERIIMEHYRLGSTRAILSRTFCSTSDSIQTLNYKKIEKLFSLGVEEIRKFEESLKEMSFIELEKNKNKTVSLIEKISRTR